MRSVHMAVSERTDHPGIRVSPPLIYASALIAGVLLNRRWPWPIEGGAFRIALGSLLVGVFLWLLLRALAIFRRHDTSMLPFRPDVEGHVIAESRRFFNRGTRDDDSGLMEQGDRASP